MHTGWDDRFLRVNQTFCDIVGYTVDESANSTNEQGSGLGLAIAQRLAQLHGRELTIESIPGKETTVRVS